MKLYNIEARDISDCWFQLVDLCYQKGRDYKVGEGSYAGSQIRRELDYVTCHIRYPQTRPLLPEIPPGLGIPNPVPEGMDYINRYLPYLLTDEQKEGEQYTYGQRLTARVWVPTEPAPSPTAHMYEYGHKLTSSQVEEVIAKFKRGYANNQACMTIAQPSDIHLSDPPCLRQIDCRIYPDEEVPKLHFFIYFRSWDLWGGFPANLAAIAHLQEYMAGEIGVETGEFVCSSKGLHLYSMYFKLAAIRLGEEVEED
jgi:thymidylate synthase